MLEVGGFDMDGGVELTLIQVYIDVQKCDFGGGGVPGELDWIAVLVDKYILHVFINKHTSEIVIR